MYDDSVNIGQFNDSYLPIMDGVNQTVQNYALWINRTYANCCVATPSFPEYSDVDPFPVLRYFSFPFMPHKPYRFGFPKMDHRFRTSMGNIDFNLVHTHSPFNAGNFALSLAKKRHIPIVATFHTKYKSDLQHLIGGIPFAVSETLKRIVGFYHSVDHVWVPQAGVGQTLREYGYTGSYEVMENGIDLDPPKDLSPLRKLGAERLKIDNTTFLGLFVGQHTEEKNLGFLVESVFLLMEQQPQFRMVFVGEGYAKVAIMKKVEQSAYSDRFTFLDVVHDRNVLREIYARADLLLFPSLYDNAPLVVREAAAFHTPSLLLEGSTAAEPINDGKNGFLSKNDTTEYARTIAEIMSHPAALKKAAEGASKSLCRSWESTLNKVVHRYKEILASWN